MFLPTLFTGLRRPQRPVNRICRLPGQVCKSHTLQSDETYTITAWPVNEDDEILRSVATSGRPRRRGQGWHHRLQGPVRIHEVRQVPPQGHQPPPARLGQGLGGHLHLDISAQRFCAGLGNSAFTSQIDSRTVCCRARVAGIGSTVPTGLCWTRTSMPPATFRRGCTMRR